MTAKREPGSLAIPDEPDGQPRPTTGGAPATADERKRRIEWRKAILIIAVIIAIGVPLIGAVVGISDAKDAEPLFVSQAVAVATKQSIPPADFAQVALAVFSTDEVLDPVRVELSLSETPAQLLANETLSAEAVEDTVAVRIVAQSPDRTQAQQLADAAVQSLSRTLSSNGIAKLTTFPASRPSTPQSPPRIPYGLLGGAVGLAVVLLLAWAALRLGRRQGWFGAGTSSVSDGS
jgi:hypothetical protein